MEGWRLPTHHVGESKGGLQKFPTVFYIVSAHGVQELYLPINAQLLQLANIVIKSDLRQGSSILSVPLLLVADLCGSGDMSIAATGSGHKHDCIYNLNLTFCRRNEYLGCSSFFL